jgi:DNA-binding transcriptional LysR family regulator
MKIDDIDAFVTAVRCQSISLAARELGLTQPAITRRIQNLEEALGVDLLDRHTKPPKPTELGWRVREQCQAVLREISKLRELAANELAPSGGVRLGVTQGIGELVLLDVLQALRSRWPELTPQIATGAGGQMLLERIEREELDAAALFLPRNGILPKHVEGHILEHTRLVVVARKGQWTRRSYKLAECADFGWVLNPDGCGFRAGLKRALLEQGLTLQVKLDTYGRELQLKSVAQGIGFGLMPLPLLLHSAFRDTIDIVPISDFKPTIDLWLVHRHALGSLQEPVQEFGHAVTRIFQKLSDI